MGTYRLLSVVLFAFACHIAFSSCAPHACLKHQSTALLEFKKTLSVDPSLIKCLGKFPKTISSWNMSRDCCLWDGVKCDELSGHVIELDLSCSQLVGKIDSNSTLFQLSHLQRLYLSVNNFSNSPISPKFSSFSSLTHLDLSVSYFSGRIPSEISQLSKLYSLHLSTSYGSNLRLSSQDFKMLLQNLTQLRELSLNGVNISSTFPQNFSTHITSLSLSSTGLYGILPNHIFQLPKLEYLSLSYNYQLSGYFPNTKWNSSASLVQLALDTVNFLGSFPESLGYLTSLQYLSLDNCNISGPIPETLSNLTHIRTLSLRNNSLNGKIPSWIFSLQSLGDLVLSDNQLQGHIPMSIQNLVNLDFLDLSSNNFTGNVDVGFFSNLKKLWFLDLSYNRISLTHENKVNDALPESLRTLELAACDVKELEFLRSIKRLDTLDLSNNKIQGAIPDWAWSNWMFSLTSLNLSHNMLTRVDSIPLQSVQIIDLRANFLQGSLPIPPNSTRLFFMSDNNLSGEIPLSICSSASLDTLDLGKNNLNGEIPQCLGNVSGLQVFMVSQNNLSGEVPLSICSLTSLQILDFGRNNLKGAIPQCLSNMSSHLEVLDMHHNDLYGDLPRTFSIGSMLRSFNLRGNKLVGKIPQSLANCKELQVLDLGDNYLDDTFPMWLGTLPKLQVLSLRSNKLHGPIRTSRIENIFPALRIIDLSYNAFTESLPMSLFQHLKAMKTIDRTMKTPSYLGGEYYQDSVIVATKGLELELTRILTVYTAIDLSYNRFRGHIPGIIGDLVAVRMLDLSHNGFQGHIPPSLGKLSVVESLDLSSNELSGEIPAQLASLTYLAFLNLSHNHLQGCIPQGNQFNTFEPNSYQGNDELRGLPISKGCGSNEIPERNSTTSALDDQGTSSQFLIEFLKAALVGYGTGLCIGLSIVYFTISTGYPIWLLRIILKLEHLIVTRWRMKQQSQRNYRRRNNRL